MEVDCTKKMGIAEGRWRRWILQIIQLLSNQDGSVLDAILLWKKNVDKEFEGNIHHLHQCSLMIFTLVLFFRCGAMSYMLLYPSPKDFISSNFVLPNLQEQISFPMPI